MTVLAIASGLLIGLSLGALGGGGSILTVPALVYLLRQSPHQATTASLLVVGIAAAMGMITHARGGRVRFGAGLVFGLLGVAGSYAGSRASAVVPASVLLAGFSVLMLAAAAAMIKRRAGTPRPDPGAESGMTGDTRILHLSAGPATPPHGGPPAGRAALDFPLQAGPATLLVAERPATAWPATARPATARPATAGTPVAAAVPAPASWSAGEPRNGGEARGGWRGLLSAGRIGGRRPVLIAAAATAVGFITGFFGVGGGFLVVPVLVLLLGFEMPVAAGTSLLVIAIDGAAALAARAGHGALALDWPLIGTFAGAAVLGALAGGRLAGRVSPQRLTAAFAALIVVVACYTLARSIPGLV